MDRYDDDWSRLAWVEAARAGVGGAARAGARRAGGRSTRSTPASRRRGRCCGWRRSGFACWRAAGASSVRRSRRGRPLGDPLAPRARVEARLYAGQLGGHEQRAGGHARAAVGHDRAPSPRRSRSSRRRQEAAAGGELGRGHVAKRRGCGRQPGRSARLAAVALRRARVEQDGAACRARSRRITVSPLAAGRTKVTRGVCSRARLAAAPPASRQARRPPSRTADRVVAEVAQQPPEAGGAALARLVVGHHPRARADAGAAGGGLEAVRRRAAGGGRRRPGAADRSRSRSRTAAPGMWPSRQARSPAPGLAEHEAAVDHAQPRARRGGSRSQPASTTRAELTGA